MTAASIAYGLILGVITPPLSTALTYPIVVRLTGQQPVTFPVAWLVVALEVTGIAALGRAWPTVAGTVISAALAAAAWWWRRRKDRRKALAAAGYKALARVAAMAAVLRERARPRPALRPGPVAS